MTRHRLPQLTAAKPRTGMQSFANLIESLIRVYEKQNEVEEQLNNPNRPASTKRKSATAKHQLVPTPSTEPVLPFTVHLNTERQTTFGFYDATI
ncbi:MAG: hypothetical protein R3C03_22370 [Pirellulaceae bacterium]